MLRQERLVAFFGHRSTWRCEHFMDVTPSFGTCFPRGVSDRRQFEDPENLRSDRGWGTIFASGRIPKRGGVGKLGGWKSACAVCLLGVATAIASPAQTFATLVDFDSTNGANPLVHVFCPGHRRELLRHKVPRRY
jgi:hypothetical protein